MKSLFHFANAATARNGGLACLLKWQHADGCHTRGQLCSAPVPLVPTRRPQQPAAAGPGRASPRLTRTRSRALLLAAPDHSRRQGRAPQRGELRRDPKPGRGPQCCGAVCAAGRCMRPCRAGPPLAGAAETIGKGAGGAARTPPHCRNESRAAGRDPSFGKHA